MPRLISLRELTDLCRQLLEEWPAGSVAVSQMGNLIVVQDHEAQAWVMLNGSHGGSRIQRIESGSPLAAMPAEKLV
jgi:hypothetical protein